MARLVTHIDGATVAALSARYDALLPSGGRILDLMSGWVSHLPADRTYAEVVGHGMNADELVAIAGARPHSTARQATSR